MCHRGTAVWSKMTESSLTQFSQMLKKQKEIARGKQQMRQRKDDGVNPLVLITQWQVITLIAGGMMALNQVM